MLGFTVVYIAGVLGQTFCTGNPSALYASRFIAGICIGATTVLSSIYLTDVRINPRDFPVFARERLLTIIQDRT